MDWFETSALNLSKAFCELKNHNSQPIQYVCIFDQCIRNLGAGNPILLCAQCVQEHSKNHSTQSCLELKAFLQQCRQKLEAQNEGKKDNNVEFSVSQKIQDFNEKILKISADMVESMKDLFIEQLVQKGIIKQQVSLATQNEKTNNNISNNSLSNQLKTTMQSNSSAKKPANLQQYKEISDFLRELWRIFTTGNNNNNISITASKSIAQQLSNNTNIKQSLKEKASDDWLCSSISGFIDEAFNHLNDSFKQTTGYLLKSQQDLESLTASKSKETDESNRQQLYEMKLAVKKRDDLVSQLAQVEKQAKLIIDDLKQQQNEYYESQQEEKAIEFRLNMKRQQGIEMQRNFNERIQALTDKQDKLKEYTFYNSEPLGINSRQNNNGKNNDTSNINQMNKELSDRQVDKYYLTEYKYSNKQTNQEEDGKEGKQSQQLEVDASKETKQERQQKFMFIERSKKSLLQKLKEGLQPIEIAASQLGTLLEETQLHNSKRLETLNAANQAYNNQQNIIKQLQLEVSSAEDAIFKLKHELISHNNYNIDQQEPHGGQQITIVTQEGDKMVQMNGKK